MQYLKRIIITFCLACVAIIYIPCAMADAAIDALNANRLDEARTLFLQQLSKTETKNSALTHLGMVEFYAGNYDQSIDYLQQAIVFEPESSLNYLVLGRALGRKAQSSSMFSAIGLAKRCIASFEKAYVLDQKNAEVLQELVQYHAVAPGIVGGSREKLTKYLGELKTILPEMARIYEINHLAKDKKHDEAVKLARDLKAQNNLLIKTQYLLAHFFKENKLYSDAEEMLEVLIKTPVSRETTIENRWYISNASLQLGEVFLATNKDLDRAAVLVKDYQQKNNHPGDIHYYWAFLSLAKIYKANGDMEQYRAGINQIKSMDYKQDKYFAEVFDAEAKN